MNPENRATDRKNPGPGGRRHPLPLPLLIGWALLVLVAGPLSAADPTVSGLSGTFLVPGLDVIGAGSARGAAHLVGSDGNAEGSVKGAFSFSDDTEVAITKRFVTGKGKEQSDPIFAAKFKVRPNVALAALIETTPGWKSSVMMLTGVPGNRIVVGVGANVAMQMTDTKAHFGRYDSATADAAVDPLFLLIGANIHLDPDTDLTMDYTGNDFVLGLRHHIDERVGLDFGYYTPDRQHTASRSALGLTFGF